MSSRVSAVSRETKAIVREMRELRGSPAAAAKVPVPAPNQDREELAPPRLARLLDSGRWTGGALGTGIALCPTGRRPCQSSPAVVNREEAIAASRDVGAARTRSVQPREVPCQSAKIRRRAEGLVDAETRIPPGQRATEKRRTMIQPRAAKSEQHQRRTRRREANWARSPTKTLPRAARSEQIPLHHRAEQPGA
jgi:hypothetical protein